MELAVVEAAEAVVGTEDHITIEVPAATTITTIMRVEIRVVGVTIAMSATSMATIVVGASAAADIITLIEEAIEEVALSEIKMIGSI